MKIKTPIIVIICVVILASGAYLAGQLFNKQSISSTSQSSVVNGTTMSKIDLEIIPSQELPILPEIARGIFVERADNIITINEFLGNPLGEGQGMVVSIDSEGSISADSDGETKQTDVLITSSTTLYRDITDMNAAINEGGGSIQQVVEEGNLEDLNNMTFIKIWGRKNGDRIIADTISYSTPIINLE